MDLKAFSKRVEQLTKNIQNNADQLTRLVGVNIDSALVLATPVDEGRARSNWQVAINTTPEVPIEPYVPGEGGSTGASNAHEAIRQGEAAIATYRTEDEIHITNNLSYIDRLNQGWSPQADPGFVEESIHAGISNARATRQTIVS